MVDMFTLMKHEENLVLLKNINVNACIDMCVEIQKINILK